MPIEITGSSRQVIVSATLGGTGWSPVLSLVADGDRRVFQVVNWVGGSGTPPATGEYIGTSGLVSSISSAVDVRGSPGLPGEGSAFYKHSQTTPSAMWTIVHNLNFEPQTQVFSLGGVRIEAFIQNLSLTTTQIIFSSPFSGYAILSR